MKKISIEILKILITIGLFYYLFKTKVPLNEVIQNIKNLNIVYLILIILLFFLYYLIFSLRWNFLLKAQNIGISEVRSYLYIIISFFFNNFLPSGLGMDMIRSAYAGGKENFEKALGASIMERILGMIGMMLIGIAAVFSWKAEFAKLSILYIGLILLTILIYYFLTSLKVSWLKEKILSVKFLNLGDSIRKFYRAFKIYKNKIRTLIIGISYSVLVQIVIIIINYFIAKGLSLQIPIFALLAYIPIITVISLIPITINGLGLREAAYVYFFSLLNVTKGQAMSLSLVFFITSVIASCGGGIVFVFLRRGTRSDTLNKDESGRKKQ
ncbi:flippase-like domain-containing protein [candidate division WOR-3 bacterium]|nr:flippase-like domain-containing protein [candidate division WOR-3 bacterium]